MNTDPTPPLTMRSLADDPGVVLDLARMVRRIGATIYETHVASDDPSPYADGDPYTMTAADLPVEVLEVEGVLRGWSVEETHGAMIERTRNRSGVPAIVMAPYREQEEEHRKHRELMRHAIELAARAILRGNGNDSHSAHAAREEWRRSREARATPLDRPRAQCVTDEAAG